MSCCSLSLSWCKWARIILCACTVEPRHTDTPRSRAPEYGQCLKTSVMFILNYCLVVELSLSQIHINMTVRWVENKIHHVIFKNIIQCFHWKMSFERRSWWNQGIYGFHEQPQDSYSDGIFWPMKRGEAPARLRGLSTKVWLLPALSTNCLTKLSHYEKTTIVLGMLKQMQLCFLAKFLLPRNFFR